MNSKVYKSYEISKYEYLELKYFCLRYDEMIDTLVKIRLEGTFAMITENSEIDTGKYLTCRKGCEMITKALALATDNEIIRDYLKRSITKNIPYERLNVPMGRRQFYELRRKFFYTLKKLKDGD